MKTSLRSRIVGVLLGPEQRKLNEALEVVENARRWQVSPEAFARQLSEVDSQLVDLVIRQRGYEPIMGQAFGSKLQFSDADRNRSMYNSRYMAHHDVLTGRAVGMWTDFGFGQRVSVVPRDSVGAEIWAEFWDNTSNQYILSDAEIAVLSNDLVKDGEEFFVFFISTLDGTCTIRRIPPEQILTVHRMKDDPDVPLWYTRQTEAGEVWYPDWRATAAQLETMPIPNGAMMVDALRPNTTAVVMHAAPDKVNGRGWPLLRRALEWARAYKDFIGDRATIAKAVAMFVDKLKVQGGSRAVNDVISQLQSSLVNGQGQYFDNNPPPATGSTWVENGAIERTRLPMGTGAGDAQTDGMTIAAQFATGAGMPLHWLGRTDAAQNRAVARESSLPAYAQINRYQNFWADTFGNWVEIVLRAAEEYGGATIETYDADVTLDTPLDADISEVNAVISSIIAANGAGRLGDDVANKAIAALTKTALSSLGVRNVDDVLTPVNTPTLNATSPPVAAVMEKWRTGEIDDAAALAQLVEIAK